MTTDTNAPILLRDDADGICRLTLNRPAQRNALSLALMQAITAELDRIAKDRAVRVVILSGAGPAFCAGHDLKELRANPARGFYDQVFNLCSEVMLGLTRLPQPVIAQVHGIATAAGCQLVATCDLAIAAADVRFATPGVNIGLFCSTPMVALTRVVPRKQAMEMLLTGDMIDAATAVSVGLINRAVPVDLLTAEVNAFADKIAGKSPLILKIGKEAFYRQAELDLGAAYAYASKVMAENMMALDAAEGIDSFLGKRQPNWKGC